ncbi:hypothetical protein [Daejeonella lutea]|uniref:Uncharacterized protein n=1 Tax=Daejeonella lutea TaxID=572036 RepID=A0A1T5EDT3_9SPHI|nr:hypothetical protein [Daejeonella lutea]SKB82009.1 hypothetical protein SAMN05661099_2915 [Daejeonella lutea]
MEIIIKRASFSADDFNSENTYRQFGSAKNLDGFVAIEIADQSFDAFKEILRETYAGLDSEYGRHALEQQHSETLEKRQMMISQIITKIFKP